MRKYLFLTLFVDIMKAEAYMTVLRGLDKGILCRQIYFLLLEEIAKLNTHHEKNESLCNPLV